LFQTLFFHQYRPEEAVRPVAVGVCPEESFIVDHFAAD